MPRQLQYIRVQVKVQGGKKSRKETEKWCGEELKETGRNIQGWGVLDAKHGINGSGDFLIF